MCRRLGQKSLLKWLQNEKKDCKKEEIFHLISKGTLTINSFAFFHQSSTRTTVIYIVLRPSANRFPSSETQGQSVGSAERARRKFSSKGERAPGYRLSPTYFQKFKRMPASDWAQKMLCIIVPNRRTVSPEFFS